MVRHFYAFERGAFQRLSTVNDDEIESFFHRHQQAFHNIDRCRRVTVEVTRRRQDVNTRGMLGHGVEEKGAVEAVHVFGDLAPNGKWA